jgi:surface-adhesin protein E
VRSPWMRAFLLIGALSPSATGPLAAQQARTSWVVISQSPALKVSLDSSRIRSDSQGTTVWLRFDYATLNPPMSDMPHAWRRMESRHVINCRARRAKDLSMVIVDTSGVRHDGSQALSKDWQAFDAHPLTPNVLQPVCDTLQRNRSHRGA